MALLLKTHGKYQSDLALALGYKSPFISELINGKKPFPRPSIKKVAKFLQVEENHLLYLFEEDARQNKVRQQEEKTERTIIREFEDTARGFSVKIEIDLDDERSWAAAVKEFNFYRENITPI